MSDVEEIARLEIRIERLETKLERLEIKLNKLELKLESINYALHKSSESNSTDHASIIERLDRSLSFQVRLKYVIGTTMLIIGSILGFIIHYASWIWDNLPMHGHTH